MKNCSHSYEESACMLPMKLWNKNLACEISGVNKEPSSGGTVDRLGGGDFSYCLPNHVIPLEKISREWLLHYEF